MKQMRLALNYNIECWLDYECTPTVDDADVSHRLYSSMIKRFPLSFEPTEDMKFVFRGDGVAVLSKVGKLLSGQQPSGSSHLPSFGAYRIDPLKQNRHCRVWICHHVEIRHSYFMQIDYLVTQCGFDLMTSSELPNK